MSLSQIEELINRIDPDKQFQCVVCEGYLDLSLENSIHNIRGTDFYYVLCPVCDNENVNEYYIDRRFRFSKNLFFTSKGLK